ncbi:putative bifunctional diguanylate cyclase/phosphodiesterase [Gilvimarinus agarilyticus]|uniref:putative bifunctional diguanylate cyclase/phosphodiesterase n=1 Tax=Gilvimarinus agarilyticus TaxID=679259 RepID=UPI0005A29A63|nr:sensor domain-containing phosphodiesterase [Gilvimarinus agarilyticus]
MGESDHFIDLHKRLVALRHNQDFIALDKAHQLIELITLCSNSLDIDRVSVWRLEPELDHISLEALLDRQHGICREAAQLKQADHKAYFRALLDERIIDAVDACTDLRTCSFTDDYLRPQNIVSMLDVPIFDHGKLYGVVCLEARVRTNWSLSSIAFVSAIADTLSLINTYEAWQQSQQELDYVTHFDDLTGLSNARALQKRLTVLTQNTPERKNSFSLIWLNIDKLKQINQGLGQSVGDQIIMAVARNLRQLVVRGKDKVARTGGNEFALIVRSTGQRHSLERTIEELLDQLLKPLVIAEHKLQVTLSAGVCFYPDDGADVTTLLRHAETAMHQAKDRGHNNARFFNAQISRDARARFTLERQLRKAIDNNSLTVLYQPIVAARGHHLVSAEALVRWQHPEHGWLTPAEFLPLAKSAGLMYELDKAVISRVCEDIYRLGCCGIHLAHVAINLGVEQVLHPHLPRNIAALLTHYHIPGHQLEFEITEDVIAHDSIELQHSLQALVRLGPGLSIDDFGTGYSSLSRLKHLPFSKLKIDRSFIQDLPGDKDSVAIVQSIIGLARGLNLSVVAEGVETDDQARWLAERDVDYLQGFKFSRPVSLDELRSNYLGAAASA